MGGLRWQKLQSPGLREWAWAAAGLLFIGLVVVGAGVRAQKQGIGTDFHVFWQAGYDFAHGLPLYDRDPGARRFLYPPFAAQVFQLLGLFPLRAAAWAFYVVSACLAVWAARLSSNIVRQVEPGSRRGPLPLVLAVLCSLAFILDNLVHVQVNLLILVLCLLGVQDFIGRKETAAAGWLTAATAIKITPVFFLAWALIRGGRRRLAAIAAFGGLCLILPILQRGPQQGLSDLSAYYDTFLYYFATGGVVTVFRNQNLAAMVYRALVPGAAMDVTPYEYAYLGSLAATAPLMYRTLALLVLIGFLTYLVHRRVATKPVRALEISSVFLAGHLLSGITFKAHLVSLLFVSYGFFSLDSRAVYGWRRGTLSLAWAALLVIGLGRDVTGSRLQHYMAGYSLYVWVMLLLLVLCILWETAGNNDVSGNQQIA